jgi:hypothetical protein
MNSLVYQIWKAIFFLQCCVLLAGKTVQAQDTTLQKQLEQSQYLRTIMKNDPANAGLTRWLKKP